MRKTKRMRNLWEWPSQLKVTMPVGDSGLSSWASGGNYDYDDDNNKSWKWLLFDNAELTASCLLIFFFIFFFCRSSR